MCARSVIYEKDVTQIVLARARASGGVYDPRTRWTQTIPGVCVLAPGHAGACRSAEQVIDQLDERPLRPLTVRGL